MVNASQIVGHMEVVGSDGQHVGTVDKRCVKLTKKDPAAQGQHHVVNLDLVASVEGSKLKFSMPAVQSMQEEKALQG